MRLWDIYYPRIPDFIARAMEAPEVRRLHNIGMNCGCEYTSFPLFKAIHEPYSRFDHSVGVALLIWRFTRDKAQALAGLFHDIATPCFAHVVDFMLGDSMTQEATEDGTRDMIEQSEAIQNILRQYGLTTVDVADYHMYPIADNDTPRLSADRLEYTIGNLVNYGLITRDRAKWMLDGLTVLAVPSTPCGSHDQNQLELGFDEFDHALPFANGALDMGRIYVSEPDRFSMQKLAELLNSAKDDGIISMDDLWQDEPFIIEKLCRDERYGTEWNRYQSYSKIVHGDGGIVVHAKKRYIDPLVKGIGRVSTADADFRRRVDEFLAESQDESMIGV